MHERPAPVVTITDPTRPAQPADVVVGGHERDPWRPTHRQLRVLGLLVAVGLAAVVPQRVVAARAVDRRAATAAADAVQLSVHPTSATAADAVILLVRNEGPEALHLEDLRVEAPGYQVQPVDQDLARGDDAVVTVLDTRRCGEELLEAGDAGQLRLRARTRAGREVRRVVLLDAGSWRGLVAAAQRRCGDLPPDAALGVSVTAATQGGSVALRLRLVNRGHAPLVLAFASGATPGLQADTVPHLPALLPVGRDRALSLTVRVRVTDCGTALSPIEPTGQGVLALHVAPVLSGGRQGPSSDLPVTDAYGEAAVRDLVAARCGVAPTGG